MKEAYHSKASVGGGGHVGDDGHGQTYVALADSTNHTSQHKQGKTVRQGPQHVRPRYPSLQTSLKINYCK